MDKHQIPTRIWFAFSGLIPYPQASNSQTMLLFVHLFETVSSSASCSPTLCVAKDDPPPSNSLVPALLACTTNTGLKRCQELNPRRYACQTSILPTKLQSQPWKSFLGVGEFPFTGFVNYSKIGSNWFTFASLAQCQVHSRYPGTVVDHT